MSKRRNDTTGLVTKKSKMSSQRLILFYIIRIAGNILFVSSVSWVTKCSLRLFPHEINRSTFILTFGKRVLFGQFEEDGMSVCYSADGIGHGNISAPRSFQPGHHRRKFVDYIYH